jgi:SAM-dependent methyltransferase
MDHDQYRRNLWANKADAYRNSFAGLCAHTGPGLLDATGVRSGTRLLDVGCGTGTLTALAIAQGATVSAVDAEPSMVASTRAGAPTADTREGVLPDLPFPDDAFDVVVANFVINHVGRPASAAAELLRLIRPEGRVGITLWPRPQPPLQQLWDEVIEAAAAVRPIAPAVAPEHDFPQTLDGAAGLLRAAGFIDVTAVLVEWQHRVAPDQWWSGAANGVAGIGYVVAHQDAATVLRMKAEYQRIAQRHLDADGLLSLPTAAVMATGTRPGRT